MHFQLVRATRWVPPYHVLAVPVTGICRFSWRLRSLQEGVGSGQRRRAGFAVQLCVRRADLVTDGAMFTMDSGILGQRAVLR